MGLMSIVSPAADAEVVDLLVLRPGLTSKKADQQNSP